MKRQILSLLAGAALLATPVMTQMVSAQGMGGNMGGGGMPRMAQGLNLTATQKAQMKVIQDRTRTQIDAVLTPAQKAQAAAAKKARVDARKTGVRQEGIRKEGDRKGGGMYKSLNLTDAQKAQIKTIMAASRKEIEALLTPEQKAQMQQKIQQRMNKRAK
jgi:periplasmic protein CpxP/Spy